MDAILNPGTEYWEIYSKYLGFEHASRGIWETVADDIKSQTFVTIPQQFQEHFLKEITLTLCKTDQESFSLRPKKLKKTTIMHCFPTKRNR